MDSPERAVRAAHAAWIEAVNDGDLARLGRLMTDDALFLNPGQAPLRAEGLAAALSGARLHSHVHCTSEVQEVAVTGDLAYTVCRDSVSATPRAGGARTAWSGHRLTLYRRHADGRWLLARDAHTVTRADGPA